jgi:hypothetical protein
MARSDVPQCGKCGGWYEPSRGGYKYGYTVHKGYPRLRDGAKEGDPLHDSCYQQIYRMKKVSLRLIRTQLHSFRSPRHSLIIKRSLLPALLNQRLNILTINFTYPSFPPNSPDILLPRHFTSHSD